MKRIVSPSFLFGVLLSLPALLFAQKEEKDDVEEKFVKGYYGHGVFYSPEAGTPFFESYITIDAGSLSYEEDENGESRSELQVTVIVRDRDSIVDFDKTLLEAPAPKDSGEGRDLVDVKRFALDPGYYRVEAELKDLNADSARSSIMRWEVGLPNYQADTLIFSDIQLVSDFEKSSDQDLYTKSGIRMTPYAAHYYPPKVEELHFYTELYNTRKKLGDSGKFALRYYLYDRDRKKVVKEFHKVRVEKASEVVPLMASMKIGMLPTGNYDLVVEARDEKNELLSRRSTFIQRHGTKGVDKEELLSDRIEETFVSDMDDEDSLRMYLRAHMPIANTVEKDLIRDQVEVMDLETMKRFLFGFWYERAPKTPEKEWLKYKARVDHVNYRYTGGYKMGFDTDRGRTVLKYGKPDQITERKHKTHSYPYEIWQYYKIGKYTNKRFVFYNTDLSTDDYDLLHSDMPGELRNRRWRRDLQDRQNVMDDVDEEDVFDHYGREVDDIFRNP